MVVCAMCSFSVSQLLQAHIFSLGATLKAALEYIMEPGTDSEFSQDLHTLLEQMQEESPKERPDIEVKKKSVRLVFCLGNFHIILTILMCHL